MCQSDADCSRLLHACLTFSSLLLPPVSVVLGGSGCKAFPPSLLAFQEVAAPVESGAAEETTLLTGPIQGDVVTINQRSLDLMLLQVGRSPNGAPLLYA